MSACLQTVQRAKPLLGTLVTVRVVADAATSAARLHRFVDTAFDQVARIQRHLSYQDAESTISRLNRDARRETVRVDEDTRVVLQAALEFAAKSAGAFDPTIAGALERWGYLPVSEPDAEHPVSWRDIDISPRGEVRFRKRLRIDLSGIAKGYAVDQACEVLLDAPLLAFNVNAGGDLRVGGARAEEIMLRLPHDPATLAGSISLKDEALATSGSYYTRRKFGKGEVSPLLDPRNGLPFVSADMSVSVRCATCMAADALTKVVLFADPVISQRLLSDYAADAFLLGSEAAAA